MCTIYDIYVYSIVCSSPKNLVSFHLICLFLNHHWLLNCQTFQAFPHLRTFAVGISPARMIFAKLFAQPAISALSRFHLHVAAERLLRPAILTGLSTCIFPGPLTSSLFFIKTDYLLSFYTWILYIYLLVCGFRDLSFLPTICSGPKICIWLIVGTQ